MEHLADTCVTRLSAARSSSAIPLEPAYQALLDAVRSADPRFAFEREGRPDAIAAVREALPLIERDLFDAVVEDHACEVAALNEVLFVMMQALARAQRA